MRFFSDSNVLYTVRWYRCRPDAQPMPFPTAFGNSFFYQGSENQNLQLGEQPNTRTWNTGAVIPTAFGNTLCGTEEQWTNGLKYNPLAPPVTRRTDGLLGCCDNPVWRRFSVVQAHGWLRDGFSATYTVGPGVTRIMVELFGSGGTNPAGPPNGPPYVISGGPGGGAYALKIFNVVEAQTFNIVATLNGSFQNAGIGPGIDIDFGNGLVRAVGGWGPPFGVDGTPFGGEGGKASECIGDIVYSGGAGGRSSVEDPKGLLYPSGAWGGGGGGTGNRYGPGKDGGDGIVQDYGSGLAGDLFSGHGIQQPGNPQFLPGCAPSGTLFPTLPGEVGGAGGGGQDMTFLGGCTTGISGLCGPAAWIVWSEGPDLNPALLALEGGAGLITQEDGSEIFLDS